MTIPPGGLQGLASTPRTDNLEELWLEDLRCQSKHLHPGNEVCTEKATHHIAILCTRPEGILICDAATQYCINWLETERAVCEECMHPINDCWKLRTL